MAAADPPGYFVGRPLHYQDHQNAVNARVPGYYKGRVERRPSDGTGINANNNAGAAVQQNQEPGWLAKLFGCFSGSSGNAN